MHNNADHTTASGSESNELTSSQGFSPVNFTCLAKSFSVAILVLATQTSVFAQDRPDPQSPPPPPPVAEPVGDRPEPDAPVGQSEQSPTGDTNESAPTDGGEMEIILPKDYNENRAREDRRPVPAGEIKLGLKDVPVKDLYEWIATQTGKAVMPVNATQIQNKKFTIIMDDYIPREEALDMLFSYLRLNGVGIIERSDVILIGDLPSMTKEMGEIDVVNADESVMDRIDRGTLILKIFAVERASAEDVLANIEEFVPEYASISVDGLSNQIMVLGDVALCQQFEVIIGQLDQKWVNQRMHTFRLKWADAGEIADNVLELFESGGSTASASRAPAGGNNRNNQARNTARSSTGGTSAVELRVTVNVQQNTLTIQAEPDVMEEIGTLIATEWDLPRPAGTSRLFFLKYTDPLKVKSLLEEVIGSGSSSTSNNAARGRGGQNNNQRGDATSGISGVYRIDAYEDKNALLVLARTVESFDFIDSIIQDIDQPTSVGLPEVIPLKYADAVELSEEINVLLAKAGARVTLPRPASGLTAQGFTASDNGSGVEGPTGETASGDLQFPWQTGGNDEEQAPESALIGKVRVVPIIRQNALAIMSPPSYQEAMRNLIHGLDQPRRQVQIAATIVEIDITDNEALGIKLGNGWTASGPALGPFETTFNADVTGFLSNIIGSGGAQTSSTLNLGEYSINVIIEALSSLTNARVIQEPRVFTADNEEAVFFSGKEYPIATGTIDAASGGLNTSTTIEYRNVGVFLNARPRITEEGAVDLDVSLELSDIGLPVEVGGTTTTEFSRKQVNSHVIILDGQTLVLGGLLKEFERVTKYSVPFLSEIPLIGPLFTFTDQELQRKELIAFVTPTVVHRPEDNYYNFNTEDLDRLESVARPLAQQLEDVDRAIDLDVYNRIQSHVKRNAPGVSEYGTGTPGGIPGGSLDQAPIQGDIDTIDPDLLRTPGEPKDSNQDPKKDSP
ncbi:MAG: secretin N-terminal domain-containing protein [Phycisphaerales bacterium]|nr:secretin N-terminal domain-containing protein [Phycisphaerales bacterium]